MKPEERARQKIDQLFEVAGWKVQDVGEMNLGASLGVAIREFPLGSGTPDYLLFLDRKAAGVVEAKSSGASGSPMRLRKLWSGVLGRQSDCDRAY